MDWTHRRWLSPVALCVAGAVVAAAGWSGYASGAARGVFGLSALGYEAAGVGGQTAVVPPPDALAAVSIPDGTTGVSPDSTLTVTAPAGEQISMVQLVCRTDAVPGAYSADRRRWASTGPLRAGATYELSAVTKDSAGHLNLQESSFSTSRPHREAGLAFVWPAEGSTVDVAQPVVLSFTRPIADRYRTAIEQALDVVSDPAQTGRWTWLSATRVDYRPLALWRPGTRVTAHLALNGLGDGHGRYFSLDRVLDFTVASSPPVSAPVSAPVRAPAPVPSLVPSVGREMVLRRHDAW